MHPLTRWFIALAVLRAIEVFALDLLARSQGMTGSWLAPALVGAHHAGVTLLEGAFFLVASQVTRFQLWNWFGALWVMAGLIWSIADPVVFALAGDHLTPSLLAHFAGPRIFTSDYLWRPIRANLLVTTTAIVLIVLVLRASARLLKRVFLEAHRPSWSESRRGLAVGAALAILPPALTPHALESPPEVVYLREALDWGRPIQEPRDIATLRAFVGLPRGARWQGPEFPLVHRYDDTPPKAARQPDIFVVSIESLRGKDVCWVSGRPGCIALPHLDALANECVVLPRFISNGFPSTEGFLATTMSAYPHDRRRVVLDFKRTRFDALPLRLSTLGYRTVRVEDTSDPDEEGHWVRRTFQESITFSDRGVFPTERAMVNEILQLVASHDALRGGQPLFIDFKTAHPHMPYEVPDDRSSSYEDHGGSERNYPACLRYVDAALGPLLAYVRARGQQRPTLLWILGDHANALSPADTSPLPTDEMVWTGAMLCGPSTWLGPARRIPTPASQVDLMPTLMALIGDRRPSAALGRNLLAPMPTRAERAVAVRPGGVRLDERDITLLVDLRFPYGAMVHGEPAPGATLSAIDLARVTQIWGRLIEQDRVWDPALLRADTARAP